jgi:hypothetical protein
MTNELDPASRATVAVCRRSSFGFRHSDLSAAPLTIGHCSLVIGH